MSRVIVRRVNRGGRAHYQRYHVKDDSVSEDRMSRLQSAASSALSIKERETEGLPIEEIEEALAESKSGIFVDPTTGKVYRRTREEQQESCDRIMEELFENDADRCQIRAACGMGKTHVQHLVIAEIEQQRADEGLPPGRYVVWSPSVDLSTQLRGNMEDQGLTDVDCVSIHDRSPDYGTRKRTKEEAEALEKELIDSFFSDTSESDTPKILFVGSTATSLNKVIEGQQRAGDQASIDMVLFDEAHNLTGNVGGRAIGKASGDEAHREMLRVFSNDDPNGLHAEKRLFMSASPKAEGNGEISSAVLGSDTNRSMTNYLAQCEKQDAGQRPTGQGVPVYQDSRAMFGKTVSSYSYAHAVDKGYLVKPEVAIQQHTVTSEGTSSVSRETPVSTDGKVSKVSDAGLTMGSYRSLTSTLHSLADDDADHSHNVLIFVNQVADAKAISDRKAWQGVAQAEAAKLSGGRAPSEQESIDLLSTPGASSDQKKAAKLVLLGKYAEIASTSAGNQHSEADRKKALDFFDDKEFGDKTPKSVPRPGGWNPCSRVVSNVDMLSEGIDIASVDTVVYDRPNMSQESAIYQAVGRACRPMYNKDGVQQKRRAKVILPDTTVERRSTSGQPVREKAMSTDSAGVARQLSGVWTDAGSEDWRRTQPNDLRASGVSGAQTVGEAASAMMDNGMGIRANIALSRVYDKVRADLSKQYRQSKDPSWEKRTAAERHDEVMQAMMGNLGSSKSAEDRALHGIFTATSIPTFDDVKKARDSSADLRRRAAMGASLESGSMTKEEALVVNKHLRPKATLTAKDKSDDMKRLIRDFGTRSGFKVRDNLY